jgi:indolepyruvate ferredoxin oxidoreductase beta subunit
VVAQIRFGRAVASPLVPEGTACALASLERIEALRYKSLLAPDGLAVVSTQAIVPVTVSSGIAAYPADAEERLRRMFPRLIYVDAVGIAAKIGDMRAANVVILGALSTALSIPEQSWMESIKLSVKPAYVEINSKAFAAGRSLKSAE